MLVFRVFRVESLGSMRQVSGFWVLGSGFRVEGFLVHG